MTTEFFCFYGQKSCNTRQRQHQLQLNNVSRILQSFIFVPEFDTQRSEFCFQLSSSCMCLKIRLIRKQTFGLIFTYWHDDGSWHFKFDILYWGTWTFYQNWSTKECTVSMAFPSPAKSHWYFFCNALLLLQFCLCLDYGSKQKFCPFTMVAVLE